VSATKDRVIKHDDLLLVDVGGTTFPLKRKVVVSLLDVRAADDITISYDYARDGWRIGMDRTIDRGDRMETVEEDVEVAFLPAWNETE
jgi:hypothetical protein